MFYPPDMHLKRSRLNQTNTPPFCQCLHGSRHHCWSNVAGLFLTPATPSTLCRGSKTRRRNQRPRWASQQRASTPCCTCTLHIFCAYTLTYMYQLCAALVLTYLAVNIASGPALLPFHTPSPPSLLSSLTPSSLPSLHPSLLFVLPPSLPPPFRACCSGLPCRNTEWLSR